MIDYEESITTELSRIIPQNRFKTIKNYQNLSVRVRKRLNSVKIMSFQRIENFPLRPPLQKSPISKKISKSSFYYRKMQQSLLFQNI